jgi:putative intracellular protease/amidase
VDVASPLGGTAPLDEGSVEAYKEDASSVKFLKKKLWENTEKLSTFLGRAKEYDAIFFVGGFGRMFALSSQLAMCANDIQQCGISPSTLSLMN